MRTRTKHLFAALVGTALLASCSRPVAYFQPTAREQFKSVQSEAVAVTPVTAMQPVSAEVVAPEAAVTVQTAAPAEQIAQAKQAVSQIEAYVRNDSKLATNKTLNKRMARLNKLLTTTTEKAAVSPKATSTRKMTLMERTMLKKMDKKIKSHVSPEKMQAMTSNIRLGLIIGAIGLILLILGSWRTECHWTDRFHCWSGSHSIGTHQ